MGGEGLASTIGSKLTAGQSNRRAGDAAQPLSFHRLRGALSSAWWRVDGRGEHAASSVERGGHSDVAAGRGAAVRRPGLTRSVSIRGVSIRGGRRAHVSGRTVSRRRVSGRGNGVLMAQPVPGLAHLSAVRLTIRNHNHQLRRYRAGLAGPGPPRHQPVRERWSRLQLPELLRLHASRLRYHGFHLTASPLARSSSNPAGATPRSLRPRLLVTRITRSGYRGAAGGFGGGLYHGADHATSPRLRADGHQRQPWRGTVEQRLCNREPSSRPRRGGGRLGRTLVVSKSSARSSTSRQRTSTNSHVSATSMPVGDLPSRGHLAWQLYGAERLLAAERSSAQVAPPPSRPGRSTACRDHRRALAAASPGLGGHPARDVGGGIRLTAPGGIRRAPSAGGHVRCARGHRFRPGCASRTRASE